jgi:hypothetical protein
MAAWGQGQSSLRRARHVSYTGVSVEVVALPPYLVILFRCYPAPNEMQGQCLTGSLGGSSSSPCTNALSFLDAHALEFAGIACFDLLHVEAIELPAQLFCPDRVLVGRLYPAAREASPCARRELALRLLLTAMQLELAVQPTLSRPYVFGRAATPAMHRRPPVGVYPNSLRKLCSKESLPSPAPEGAALKGKSQEATDGANATVSSSDGDAPTTAKR